MNSFSWIFLLALAASVILKLWLAQRQIRHVGAHRGAVPEAFAGRIPLEDHQKGADYTLTNTRQGRLELVYSSLLLLGWTLGGGLQWLDGMWQQAGWDSITTGNFVGLDVWLEGLRHGHSFVSSGPLVELRVNGRISGEEVELPAAGGMSQLS